MLNQIRYKSRKLKSLSFLKCKKLLPKTDVNGDLPQCLSAFS